MKSSTRQPSNSKITFNEFEDGYHVQGNVVIQYNRRSKIIKINSHGWNTATTRRRIQVALNLWGLDDAFNDYLQTLAGVRQMDIIAPDLQHKVRAIKGKRPMRLMDWLQNNPASLLYLNYTPLGKLYVSGMELLI